METWVLALVIMFVIVAFLSFVAGLYFFASVILGFICGLVILGIGVGVARLFTIKTNFLITKFKEE